MSTRALTDCDTSQAAERDFLCRVRAWADRVEPVPPGLIAVSPHGLPPDDALAIGRWWQAPEPGDVSDPFPTIWDDPEIIRALDESCWNSAQRLLAHLADRLNAIHGVDHPTLYWELLLAPWLVVLNSTVIDHRLACLGAHNLFPEALFLTCATTSPPQTAESWLVDLKGAKGKHVFLSLMLEAMDMPRREVTCSAGCCDGTSEGPVAMPSSRARAIVARLATQPRDKAIATVRTRLISFLFGSMSRRRVEMIDCRLSFRQALTLYTAVRGCRIGSRSEVLRGDRLRRLPRWTPDPDMRSHLLGIPASTEAEAVVTSLLPTLLPMSVLEGYKHVVEESRWLYGQAVQLVHGNYRWDEVQNEFIARCVTGGRRVCFVQHGGSYGQLEVDSLRRIELRPEVEFVSWGWRAPGVTPLPSFQLSQIRNRHRGGTAVPVIEGPYRRMLGHCHIVSANGELLDRQEQEVERFIAAIDDSAMRSQVIRKPLATVNTSKERLPSAVHLMTHARVAVVTYFDTPVLEAFAANVPMIAFWNPATYGVRPETASILRDMASVGILHADPVAAAAMVVQVYPQAEAWWSQDAVQDVRHRFLEQFALSTGWREAWVPYLRDFASRR